MAAPVVANILYGPAVIWFKAVDSSFNPATLDTTGATSDLPSPWVRYGFTEGPTAFKYNREEKSVMTNEHLSAVARFTTMEEGTFTFTLKEPNPGVFNLAAGLEYTTSVGTASSGVPAFEQFAVGGQPGLAEHMWCLSSTYRNAAGVALPVRLYIWRGTSRLTNALAWEREETPSLEVEVSALVDINRQLSQRLFAYRKVTAPAL